VTLRRGFRSSDERAGASAKPATPEAAQSWQDWIVEQNAAVDLSGRRRQVRDLDDGRPQTRLAGDGREVVSFASNDYLGLTQHPAVIAAAQEAAGELGTGSGSARLIVGSRPVHSRLEGELAGWKGTEAALLFTTGFAANLGVLATLGRDPDTLVVSDELNHASIIDGTRLARGRVAVYQHGDVGRVEDLLARHDGRALVVSDSVFSMDGDVAPLDDLADVCAAHGALLVLDEAHAVLGPPTPRRDGLTVLVVGTLSKTLGSLGGFVAGPRAYVDLLTSTARSFIFTTATPPADAAAALAALAVVRSAEGEALVARLRRHVDRIRPGHPSPIIPVLLGDEDRALAAAAELLDRGLLVPAIRPPTVAPGTCRLRVALSAAHTDEQVEALAAALVDLEAPVAS
jgi:8-amino-7-oxononanoate synthase